MSGRCEVDNRYFESLGSLTLLGFLCRGSGRFFFQDKNVIVSTKLITRYSELKEEAEGFLLLMQVGAFMQVMDDDARAVSAVTGLKLQMAGDVDAPVVAGGFPKSGLDLYVGRLARAGHSVAVALQGEDKERRLSEVISVNCKKIS